MTTTDAWVAWRSSNKDKRVTRATRVGCGCEHWILLTVVLMFIAGCSGCGPRHGGVRQIEIKTSWFGLGTPQKTDLTIRNDKGTYRLGTGQVDAARVEALVAALRESPTYKPDMLNLGMNISWLKAHVCAVELKTSALMDAADNQKELYRRWFTDPQLVANVLPLLFGHVSYDDYPSATVEVTFGDGGSTVSASTHSYYVMMLPWEVTSGKRKWVTYNANISRSMAALMPEGATDRERLDGSYMDIDLAYSVLWHLKIKKDWELLDLQNKTGDALPILRTKYKVRTAEINSFYYRPEYGKQWVGWEPQETNLHASLQKGTFAPNVTVALVLPWHAGKVEGVREFLSSGDKYETLALSVPWLKKYIRGHARWFPNWDDIYRILAPPEPSPDDYNAGQEGVPVRISYVNDASLGGKGMRVFAADMHAMGKDSLAEEVRRQQSQVALLITGSEYGESYWIVLPDRRVALWRYAGPSGLLRWKLSDFPAHDCSEYQGIGIRCVGAVVSPDGELVE